MTEHETPITARCKAWRDVLPVHSACEIIPAYDDAKLIELGRDLKVSGMKLPIIVLVQPDDTRTLLDGRSRLDALCHVGIKFEVKVIDGHVVIDAPGYDIPAPTEIVPDANFNAYAFVLSTNLHRRHLKNEDKRSITKKVIAAQPALSDRAIAKMAGVSDKTVKTLRLEIEANAEIRISDRVEATGRKARGRKPKPTEPANTFDSLEFVLEAVGLGTTAPKPVETTVAPKPAEVMSTTPANDKPPITPIAGHAPSKTGTKPAVGPNGFDAAEALAVAQRIFEVLSRPVSAPNNEAARTETRRLINLLLAHKTPKPSTAGVPARAA
jgi:hypothetical protein